MLTPTPQVYDMYLDDGISRDSAPSHEYVPEASVSAGSGYGTAHDLTPGLVDPQARCHFCHVKISQVSPLPPPCAPAFPLFPPPPPVSFPAGLFLVHPANTSPATQKTTLLATEDATAPLRVTRRLQIRTP